MLGRAPPIVYPNGEQYYMQVYTSLPADPINMMHLGQISAALEGLIIGLVSMHVEEYSPPPPPPPCVCEG